MSTDTLSNPAATKSWLLVVIMFIAGLGGGAIAIALLPPSGDKPTAPSQAVAADATSAAVDRRPAASAEDATLQEIRLLREEVEQLRSATHTVGNNDAVVSKFAARSTMQQSTVVPQASAGQRTLTYWNELNSIMSREAAMRAAPPQITAANAMSFVSGRTSAFAYASAAIRQLSTQGVDPQAVGIGSDIAAWYDQGIANSRSAESLLGSDDVAARQGAPGQSWSSAEKQHREACLAINRRGAQLRQELSRKYGIDFPALQ